MHKQQRLANSLSFFILYTMQTYVNILSRLNCKLVACVLEKFASCKDSGAKCKRCTFFYTVDSTICSFLYPRCRLLLPILNSPFFFFPLPRVIFLLCVSESSEERVISEAGWYSAGCTEGPARGQSSTLVPVLNQKSQEFIQRRK